MKYIFTLLISLFLLISCNSNFVNNAQSKSQFDDIFFDVVNKEIIFEGFFPDKLKYLAKDWFDKKVKVDGFEGKMSFILSDYTENISSINDGKRIDAQINFQIIIDKPLISNQKKINGKVSTYGTIVGNFSLNDFDIVVEESQLNLINRLSEELRKKI